MNPDDIVTSSLTAEQYQNPRCVGNYFGEAPYMVAVATRLRQAWLLRDNWIEGEPLTRGPTRNRWFEKLAYCIQESSSEEIAAMRNPDRENISTPLREGLYFLWNHVFVDASKAFTATIGAGEFFGPSYETLEVRFPGADTEGDLVKVDSFSYDTDIMLVPAFLEPGIELCGRIGEEAKQSMKLSEDSDDDKTPKFSFNATNSDWVYLGKMVYWIKGKERVNIYLPKLSDMAGKLACVLVCGKYPE
ncbi:unnamed protein product [Clonostachys solani]|uniref:Uncharacterized protein n=1 Tax=Clonostachys solani TaxID=160281 RepID=A0A9N9Z4M5_9HYPO|nr:unnamed protein product [Clonostachys solani]